MTRLLETSSRIRASAVPGVVLGLLRSSLQSGQSEFGMASCTASASSGNATRLAESNAFR
eukprot:CAMPEP_0197691150 /NCGR_PEP_ID=MMETSP1338-20131121/109324_1 /TAXON_ID=43686 ORGANISM="Pelagodinium beii, Strain RCC1491" /NCGR_SAMPLE_ID=MMETSP1338 /ASSEMBLY_ACC=CAM_ASM_000754 /LENGTH=59 /DNA_ID=CAMNT_0043273665 /DNA_START=167 /DNA_END=342 /DNA_ORIENTATION=-